MSVIYSVMGVLVWLLVNNLRTREAKFVHNLEELDRTRQQLLSEEKLAAIGRLSRAIAHEIRNPVAMISSSLATATRPGQDETEREEMFSIAAKEAVRLERLTTDFLVYARPRPVQIARANLADTLNYVATVARAHAANEGVTIDVAVDSNLEGEFDATQMHQALLNLVLNAIDACDRGDLVKLNAQMNGNGTIRIDVVDPAGPISAEIVARIFEPLFTTKQGGNGLGLAIARNIARAHGSDIALRYRHTSRANLSIRGQTMGKILVVDDEPHLRRILISNLKQEHHEVIEAAGVNDARGALAEHTFDAVITDQKMGDGEGLDVLAAAREADPNLSVLFLTAFATIELAVESMRRGAFDFITKPFVPEVLLASVTRAMEHTRLVRENSRLRDTVVRLEGSSEITGRSAAIRQLREKIARVAPTNATVLVTGETGTGKELVARAIHRSSLRAEKTLIAVNCAAFTETLLESELFGHERGAFTGADRAREGVFEAANEGTLFLDEAAEMSLAAQAKLLRVLTDGLITRLGSTKPRHTDVRLLVATNRDLKRRVEEGLFREDLYYRLAVVPLTVPPLRDHREDIPDLCALFLAQAVRDLNTPPRRISAEAIRTLVSYDFPGNIRELRNLIERACILSAEEEITPENFPVSTPRSANGLVPRNSAELTPDQIAEMMPETHNLRDFLASLEKAVIQRALKMTDGAQAEVARRLGMSRSDLSYKLGKQRIKDAAG
jgi:DNA-binding NtrC family response regulator